MQIADFEARLGAQIEQSLLKSYGLKVVQVGIERLTLPSVTLAATVDRMRAERDTIATERTRNRQAPGRRNPLRRRARCANHPGRCDGQGGADRSRIARAVGRHLRRAYAGAPQLYKLLRSLDTLGTLVNPGTRLILRTDAAPFRALVDGPPDMAK